MAIGPAAPRDITIDGKTRIAGDERRGTGLHANAAMRVDPHLGNVTLQDLAGGSAVFYDTKVKVVKAYRVKTETAVRIAPRLDVRQKARDYAPEEKKHYYAQLIGYQRMPVEKLLTIVPVRLAVPASALVSRAGVRVNCSICGEEIINEREDPASGRPVCPACSGPAYYFPDDLRFDLIQTTVAATNHVMLE
jgi:hypothetical protein